MSGFVEYKRYLICDNMYSDNNTLCESKPWVTIKIISLDNNWNCKSNLLYYDICKQKNHPIVEKGLGYWMTDTVIITGYKLKSNKNVYRPIFSYKRDALLKGVINMIKDIIGNGKGNGDGYGGNIGGGKFLIKLRRNMAMTSLLGVSLVGNPLPVDIIRHISLYI